MGRFCEWSSVSFNVTITNFFGTIERFGITLTSLQANFTFRLTIAQIRTKGKNQFSWSSLEKHFFVLKGETKPSAFAVWPKRDFKSLISTVRNVKKKKRYILIKHFKIETNKQ